MTFQSKCWKCSFTHNVLKIIQIWHFPFYSWAFLKMLFLLMSYKKLSKGLIQILRVTVIKKWTPSRYSSTGYDLQRVTYPKGFTLTLHVTRTSSYPVELYRESVYFLYLYYHLYYFYSFKRIIVDLFDYFLRIPIASY